MEADTELNRGEAKYECWKLLALWDDPQVRSLICFEVYFLEYLMEEEADDMDDDIINENLGNSRDFF